MPIPKRGAKPATEDGPIDYVDEDATPKRRKQTVSKSLDVLRGKARQYVDLRDKEKAIKSEKEALSKALKEAAISQGVLDGRSNVLDLGEIVVSNVAAVSNQIDHAKAVEVLKRLNLLERCTTRVLDESALTTCFQEGLIDMEDIDSFTTESISFRIDVRVK